MERTNYKEWIGEDIEILYKPSVKDAEEADCEEITDEEEVEDGYDMDDEPEEDEEYDPDGIDDQETQLLHEYHADQRGSWNRHC